MCLSFHIRVLHFFGIFKKKSIYTKHLCFLSQNFFSQAYLILGAQTIYAQNRYNAIQTDLKYPLAEYWTSSFYYLIERQDGS